MNCCSPGRGDGTGADQASGAAPAPGQRGAGGAHPISVAEVPGGRFEMGDAFDEGYRADGELPVHEVTLSAFDIDVTTVTNAAFEAFVVATGYRTDAERFGSSAVFAAYVTDGAVGTSVPGTPWWINVPGAQWAAPYGPGSDLTDRSDHPVVHVSQRDALAYCDWAGRTLPTEAQWEYAARGGQAGARFPWGDEHPGRDDPRCNIFVGTFPDKPTAPVGTVPAESYAPNGFGLYQMVGNVWEWCADRFSARAYRRAERLDPCGPERGNAVVLRGGSHLCHDSYCYRYRVAARSHNTPDSSASNVGFRTVSPR